MFESETKQPKPGWQSIFLGLFVIFQVVYLPLANLMQLAPREMPPKKGELNVHVQRDGAVGNRWLQEGINAMGSALDRWSELSGQSQFWSLFAPDFDKQSIFPVVEFNSFNERQRAHTIIPSKRIPTNFDHYFRWPGSSSRPASYEFLLVSVYSSYTTESLEAHGKEWRDAVFERVREQQRSLKAYFTLQMRLLRTTSKDIPDPDEVILSVRVIPSPPPGSENRPASYTVPLARWYPNLLPDPEFLPVEAYDPVAKSFVRLPAEEGR
jgi:hypothetical protein